MKAKRLIAVVLAFLLIFGNAFSVNAAGIVGEMITDASGLNRLTVSAALNNYFNSREAFLLNQADTINVPLAGVVEDEAAHRAKYVSENIVFVDSSISIGDIVSSDTQADVEVTETVTYMKDSVTYTATVAHTLFLGLNNDNYPVVIYDGYYEAFSDFQSCAYVDVATVTTLGNDFCGSGSCISHIAYGELNYAEDASGYTKYGAWYGLPTSAWCAMFVAWCAAQANISESIILKTGDQEAMRLFFDNQNRYYARSEDGDAFSPQTGDLVFFTENGTSSSHIGIVYDVDSQYIHVVHGNNSQGKVAYMPVRRTNDWILGYARPAYANTGHTNNLTRDFNTTQHWFSCANCGLEGAREAHSIKSYHDFDDNFHWFGCAGCSYAKGKTAHALTYVSSSTQHKGTCETCGYIGAWEIHDTDGYENDETYHWEFCSTCNQKVGKEKHMFDEVLWGRVYMCVDCGYQSDSPNDIEIDEEVS